MLTQKAIYALKSLVYLTKEYGLGPVRISEIATKEMISKKFMEQILLELKHHGLVQSKRGNGGGYVLAKQPWQISLGYVIRAIDGPLALIPCVSKTAYGKCKDCPGEQNCGIHSVMKEVREVTVNILDGASLQDVINRERRLNGILSSEIFSLRM
ncbi:MAG: Rrf2 family transcriptional regulator [Candidatus Omnitrophota bacterium]|jgi:Rrf2 family protein|nr:MAG: Rrf2 family transcriptional regulator [Candidatus Omnitrophota bacterium]